MAYEKAAFIGLGLTFATIFTAGGIRAHQQNKSIEHSKQRLSQMGMSQNQIEKMQSNFGQRDILDRYIMGQPLVEKSQSCEWETAVKMLEQQGKNNKFKINNVNVDKLSRQIMKATKGVVKS